jgi:hypothetical protein
MEYLICDATVSGADAEVYVNEIPLSRLVPGLAEREAMPVNQFLVHGENSLGILIRPGPSPAMALSHVRNEKPGVPIRVTASLTAYPAGAIPGEDPGREIARVEQEIPFDRETRFPNYVETRFSHAAPAAQWSWQGASRLTLDDRLRDNVLALLTELTESLERADGSHFLSLARLRFEENAIAYGEGAESARLRWNGGLQELSRKPNWTFARPSLESMSLRLCAGSRLIDCKANDWRPVIRARRNEYGMFLVHYPIFLAKVGGQLQIVR